MCNGRGMPIEGVWGGIALSLVLSRTILLDAEPTSLVGQRVLLLTPNCAINAERAGRIRQELLRSFLKLSGASPELF